MKNLAILLLLAICCATIVQSKVFFVSNFGSDDNKGLTSENPFKTIHKAYKNADHGDIIKLAPGVYQGPANCLNFNDNNVTLIGPAKFNCQNGIRITGVNFQAVNVSFPNITIVDSDNVTFRGVKISKGFNAYKVGLLNFTSVFFTQGVEISTTGCDFYCTNCRGIGEGFISIKRGGLLCNNCDLPLYFVNATKPTSMILDQSSIAGISIEKLQHQKNPMNLTNLGICNITNTNITCEDSGYSGLSLISTNCTIINGTIGNCTTGNNTNSGVAVYMNSSNSTFYNVTVQNNYGNSSVYVDNSSNFTMVNGSVNNNWGNETTNGTGVYVGSNSYAVVSKSKFHENIGYNGAAFYVEESSELVVEDSTIENNHAYISGDFGCSTRNRLPSISLKNNVIRDNHSYNGRGSKVCFD